MTTQQTLGPWSVQEESFLDDGRPVPQDILGPKGEALAMIYSWRENSKAIARLIAAAPDLLTACKTAFDFFNKIGCGETDEESELGMMLMNTINKAEGELK